MKELGLHTAASAQELVQVCDIVFLAVKPQNFEEVLTEICSAVTESTLFVTIAAGISTSYIRSKTTKDCQVIRAMPNTPLLFFGWGQPLSAGQKMYRILSLKK